METIEPLITTIRDAVATGATEDVRRAGAHACRTLLAALDATEGQALVQAPAAVPPLNGLQGIVALLRSAPPEQLMDLAIAKLRTLVPTSDQLPVRAFPIHLVPVRKP